MNLMATLPLLNQENFLILSSPIKGEDSGGGGHNFLPPHPHPLPPGEREIMVLFSN
jgi:hypothetical protein